MDEPKHHIILLPSENYWEWVQAVREYAIRFRASLTARALNAVSFHQGEQIVSIINVLGAYPAQQNIVEWFAFNASEIALDVITVATPAELRSELTWRMKNNKRFGNLGLNAENKGSKSEFRLLWPTDYPVITQPFGTNPELYRHWGLPGHDGIDIRAPLNCKVYACADGAVYRVHSGMGGHPYGVHVRIRHADGYKTIYAHLNQILVQTGQPVKAGDVIGLADSTGNSSGNQLHLTLKLEGATHARKTPFPGDVIDPTPFLAQPHSRSHVWVQSHEWPHNEPLVGIVGRYGSEMEEPDWAVCRTARVNAIRFSSDNNSRDVTTAIQINSEIFILVQASVGVTGPTRAAQYVEEIEPVILRFYDAGVRFFEIHNQPNLTSQGNGVSWRNGNEFGQWFLEVVGLLRPEFPEAKFGWPGLSPGPATAGVRQDYLAFLGEAAGAIPHADWIGSHCYWENESQMFDANTGSSYKQYIDRWPDKLLLITEFCNPSSTVSAHIKGNQYLNYYRHLRDTREVAAAFCSVVSAKWHYEAEAWRVESGQPTAIVTAVASRPF